MRNVLLPIKPKFADLIFSGEKKFEFRKVRFKEPNLKKVYLYASTPVAAVVGEFEIEEIITCDPETLWKKTRKSSGTSKEEFGDYFRGKQIGHALKIRSPRRYKKPKTLEMFDVHHPPRSFKYIK